MKVVVIGAGIIGVSIASELAARGAEVTLIDKDAPGTGTSSTSFAWVNSNNKNPDPYFELNRAGLEAHHRLAASGGDWFHPTGHLEVAVDPGHRTELQARLDRLSSFGYEAEKISAMRAGELIPDLRMPESATAAFFAHEGHCDPSLYLRHVMGKGAAQGVEVRSGSAVASIAYVDGRIRLALSDGTTILADRVISATGRWTNDVMSMVGLPPLMVESEQAGDVTMGYLAITNPLPVSINRVLTSPRLNVRPAGGGRLILQALDLDVTAEVGVQPGLDSSLSKEFVSRLQQILRNTEAATIREIQVAQRAIPMDGLSVIGPVDAFPPLYLVATHSGVTLAPFLGSRVAAEVFGEDEPLFASFRPERLLTGENASALPAPRRPGEQ